MRQAGCASLGLILLTICLAGCGPVIMSTSPDREFPQRVTDGRAELRWRCSWTEARQVRIEGVANNPFHAQPIRSLQIQVFGVDSNSGSVLLASTRPRDLVIRTNARSPFEVTFAPPSPDARFDFMYTYRFDDSEPLSRGGVERSLARNVCPDLQP